MNCAIFCRISWNEMLWSAWMPPLIRPVSCCGKKPFGTIDVEIDVDADRRQQDQQHDEAEWSSAQRKRALIAAQHGVEHPLAGAVEAPLLLRDRVRLSSSAHIIGVVASETASEIRIATDSVMANSRNRRPTMPPISRIGMNTAHQRDAHRHDGEADLAGALDRGLDAAACRPRCGAKCSPAPRWRRRPRSRWRR